MDGKCIYLWLLNFPIEDSGNDCVGRFYGHFKRLCHSQSKRFSQKQKITSLFQTKFPHIENFQYDFVKRERNKICMPTTERSFSWCFSALKNLWGQGKLYCRLNVTRDIVEGTESDDDSESYSSGDVKNIWHQASSTHPSTSSTWSSTSTQHSTSNTPPLTSATHPSTSATHSSTSATHPSTSSSKHSTSGSEMLDDIANCVSDLQNLVHKLLDKQEKRDTFNTLNEALTHLNSKLHDCEHLHVDQSYVLEEAIAYYKSPEFQPYAKMIIQYKGQSAVDTGGVLRQFFTDVFTQIMEGGGDLPPLFEGYSYRKLPVYNAGTVLCGVLELVGKIIIVSFKLE